MLVQDAIPDIPWGTLGPVGVLCIGMLVLVFRFLSEQRKAAAAETQAQRDHEGKIQANFIAAIGQQRAEFRETIQHIHTECTEASNRMEHAVRELTQKLNTIGR